MNKFLSILLISGIIGIEQQTVQEILDRMQQDLLTLQTLLKESNEVKVTNSTELQDALNGNNPTISVQSGNYIGNFHLPKKSSKTIVTGLKFNGRASVGLNYPKLIAGDITQPVLQADEGARDYEIIGLEFTGVSKDRDLIVIGTLSATSIVQQPINITFTQCYFHSNNDDFGHRGLAFNLINGTVKESYFRGFVEVGRDSQAIHIGNGPGPYLIDNNYIEASGENILIGGVDPHILNLIPSDITISNNSFYKPLDWKLKYKGSVKNLFELKNAKNVRILNNTFENLWVDAQPGSAIVITPRNQDGNCPWCAINDITFYCNSVKNVENFAINILGTDNLKPSGPTDTVLIDSNLMSAVGAGIQLGDGVRNPKIIRNIILGTQRVFLNFYGIPTIGFEYSDNFAVSGDFGITGTGTGVGTPVLTKFAPNGIFSRNTVEITPKRTIPYPAGTTLVQPGTLNGSNWKCN